MRVRPFFLVKSLKNYPKQHQNQTHQKQGRKDGLVVFGQPVGQKNVKVVFGGVGVFSGDDGKGARPSKQHQYNAFHDDHANGYPGVNIDVVKHAGVKNEQGCAGQNRPDEGV